MCHLQVAAIAAAAAVAHVRGAWATWTFQPTAHPDREPVAEVAAALRKLLAVERRRRRWFFFLLLLAQVYAYVLVLLMFFGPRIFQDFGLLFWVATAILLMTPMMIPFFESHMECLEAKAGVAEARRKYGLLPTFSSFRIACKRILFRHKLKAWPLNKG
jgi:hypothetical protein